MTEIGRMVLSEWDLVNERMLPVLHECEWIKEIESVRFNQCSSMKLNVKYYTDTENRVECGLPWVNECHEP